MVAFPRDVTPPVKFAFVTTVVAFPTEVTIPVRLALVVTWPDVRLAAVPLMLVPTNADGVSKSGEVKTALDARTKTPVPVPVYSAEVK